MSIVFVGGGNMGRALAGGLIAQGRDPASIEVVEINAPARERLERELGVHTVAELGALDLALAQTIVLAVKPQSMRATVAGLAPHLRSALVISIAAGIRLHDLSRWLNGYQRLVRAMPNTPALIRRGITGLYAPPEVTAAERDQAEAILAAVGQTIWCRHETQIDAITALSGSGPAYLFYFLESLMAAGTALGFSNEESRRLAYATASGAIALAEQSADDPSVLRAQVTSKGGTTEAALAALERSNVKSAFIDAIRAADARARELGDLLGGES